MSADPSGAGEEEIEPGVPDAAAGAPSHSSLEVHLHRGFLDIDFSVKSSGPGSLREHDAATDDGEYQRHRLAGRGRGYGRTLRWPRRAGKSRPSAFRTTPATSEPLIPWRRLDLSPASRRIKRRSASFWGALSPVEQDRFSSKAEPRIFAAGARLMREGEAADHVVVILDGQTKICIDDRGTERIIARRGPGELIGERAALQVSVRSATVVALVTVEALVMQTADFAAFLSAHPDVLGIVENQVYDRLTEEAPHLASDHGLRPSERIVADEEPALSFRHPQAQPFTGENCTVVYTDVVGFSSAQRDDHDRLLIRHELAIMTYAALKAVWSECFCDDRGDGLLVVIPPTVPTSKVLEYLLVALPIALKQHNKNCDPGARFQLRAALDVGAVVSDEIGVSGEVIINTKRLLDSQALKRAIGDSEAPLGLVVSETVFQYTVKHARSVTDPAAFKKTRVRAKDRSLPARISLVSSPLQGPRRRPLLAVG